MVSALCHCYHCLSDLAHPVPHADKLEERVHGPEEILHPLDALLSLVSPHDARAEVIRSLERHRNQRILGDLLAVRLRNWDTGHASHVHLISMYSPSYADFLTVESVICFFIGWNSCLWRLSAILLSNYVYSRIDSLQSDPWSCGD